MQLLKTGVLSFHGFFISVAIVVMLLYAFVYASKHKFDVSTLMYLTPAAILFGFAGARLLYVTVCDQEYVDQADKWRFTDGGYSLFGTAAGVVLTAVVWWLITKRKQKLLPLFDTICASAPLAIAIGRLGSIFSMDCLGDVVENDGLRFFPISIYNNSDESFHYAIFFYEAVWCVVIFFFIIYSEEKLKRRGVASYVFTVLYCGLRSVFESLRTDSMSLGFIKISQIISVFTLIGAFVWMCVKISRLTGFKPKYLITYGIFTASFVIAFLSQFFMYSNTKVRNTVIMLICCFVMMAVALYNGVVYIDESNKKKNRKKRLPDKTRRFSRVAPAETNKGN